MKVVLTGGDGMCFQFVNSVHVAWLLHTSEAAVRSAIKHGNRYRGYKIDYVRAA